MVSNKTLALIIVTTMIVSLGGTLMSLNKLQEMQTLQKGPVKEISGMVGYGGNVSFNIGSLTACSVTNNVTFGSITSYSGTQVLSTNDTNTGATGANDCTSNAACQGLMVNNTGNTNVLANITSTVNASGMLLQPGITDDRFQFVAYNGTTAGPARGGCVGTLKGWTYANITMQTLCTNLTFSDTADTLTVEFNVTIDASTPNGGKSAQLIIDCIAN